MLTTTHLVGFGSGVGGLLRVASSNTSTSTGTANHSVDLPASVAAGDTLIVGIAVDNISSPDISFPGGWTELDELDEGGAVGVAAAWRKATGTEGGTSITVTSSNSNAAHFSYTIKNAADPTVTAPNSATAGGTSSTPDPPNLAPGSTKEFLWIAVAGIDFDAITGFPTNYDDAQVNSDEGSVAIAAATRLLEGFSENPGTFTASASDEWVCFTIAVHPP